MKPIWSLREIWLSIRKSPSLFFNPISRKSKVSMASVPFRYYWSSKPLRPNQPALLVFSGGTTFNGFVEELKKLTTRVAHVHPVSDDGGSTVEIVLVLGGPAVGDIPSRCLRLSDQSTAEALAAQRLLGHRLSLIAQEAKSECIGNFLFAGARIFSQSLDAAILLVSRVLDIPPESLIFPVISTNDR